MSFFLQACLLSYNRLKALCIPIKVGIKGFDEQFVGQVFPKGGLDDVKQLQKHYNSSSFIEEKVKDNIKILLFYFV